MDSFLKKYSWVLTLFGIALCASFLGRATASVLVATMLGGDGPPPVRRASTKVASNNTGSIKDLALSRKRNTFCSTGAPLTITPDKVDETGPVDTTPQRSSLNLQLLATMVSPGDFEWSMAVIRDTASERKEV